MMISISVAFGFGAFGIQIISRFVSPIDDVTEDHGVTMRYASVTPFAIGFGRGHFSINLSLCLATAPLIWTEIVIL